MNKGRLKTLEIDPLELPRQKTIMEFFLYKKMEAIECLQRSSEQKGGENKDHITDVIQVARQLNVLHSVGRSSWRVGGCGEAEGFSTGRSTSAGLSVVNVIDDGITGQAKYSFL